MYGIRMTMYAQEPLAEQIAAEVRGLTLDRLELLLGPRAETDLLRSQLDTHARVWAANLLGDDDRLAAQTVIDLMAAIYPDDDQPQGDWWRTPFGRAVARSVGHPTAESVSFSVAGAMLGISKGRVQTLLAEHKLDRHPDGGITVTSVRQRVRRMEATS